MIKRKYNLLLLILLFMLLILPTGCSKKASDETKILTSNQGNIHIPVAQTGQDKDNFDELLSDQVISYYNDIQLGQGSDDETSNNIISLSTSEKKKSTGKEEKNTTKEKNTEKEEKKKIVAIDAGHQKKGNYDKEPIGPGAKTKKAKVSSGTQGAYTKVPEYELNLTVAKKVKKELIKRGYEVVMIRETHDVNISNKERADIANESGADIFIRIHADGSTNPKVSGTSTLYPSKKNPYVADLSEASYALSKAIVDAICEKTGSKNRGAIARDDMSGINWSKIPVTIIEMGYMTNKTEDKLMQTKKYQNKIVQGICNGIDQYFENLEN